MQEKAGIQLLAQLDTNTYIFFAVLLLSTLFLIHIYSLRQEKKKLEKIVGYKVDVFEKAFDISEDAILVLSKNNEIVYANRSMVKLLSLADNFKGEKLQKMPKVKVRDMILPLDEFIEQEYRKSDQMHIYPQSILLVEGEEEEIPVNLYLDSNDEAHKGELWRKIISIHDLRKNIENEKITLKHQLTGLPNQAQLQIDLNRLFAKKHLDQKKIALVLIDIDNFSMLRSIIGHEQANMILQKFSQYLMHLPKNLKIKVYHTHHNNFLLVVTDVENFEEVIDLSKEIQRELKSFYKMKDIRLYLTASIGIAFYPDSGSRITLLDHAYQALSSAQKEGYGRHYVYLPENTKSDYDELLLYNEMHLALEKGEFEIYYQPIVNTRNEEIVAAEALIRWNHPKYGTIPPNIFIPIMEKTGFIIELGEHILDEVLKQIKRWELFKFKEIMVSINITLLELEKKGFAEYVSKKLQYHHVNPELLKFEITEGYAMKSEYQTQQEIWALKRLGISIALDDFGTGYTSFSYLKKFPSDILKIDKTMVDYILTNKQDQRIVKAMIELGHNLGMEIIVEGIENRRMYDLVVSYGCDYIQGYYVAKPLPVFEFQKLLRHKEKEWRA